MSSQFYVVATLWIRQGEIAAFEAYERKAAAIMQRYGGSFDCVVRSDADQPGDPFEVHLIRFPSREMFQAYRSDAELKALSTERDAAITKTVVVAGSKNPPYAT
jgi:uncharacterized protein (DUF1330 family)